MTKRSEAERARARTVAASYPADLRTRIVREAYVTHERLDRTGRPRWLGAKLGLRSWFVKDAGSHP